MRAKISTIAVLLLALSCASVGHLFAARTRAAMPVDEDLLFVPSGASARALSLGQTELFADLIYLRTVIYFGTEVTTSRHFDALVPLFDTIVALDPHWKTPYRWAGVATMYNGLPITPESVAQSSRFLRLGVQQFPGDWELPFMLGCNLLFELHPTDPTEKQKLMAEGVAYIQRASLVGGAPSWAALLAATILRKEGREDAALRHLEQVYYATSDEKTRQDVKARLLSLKASIDFTRDAKERAAFDAAWKATLPYGPSDLYVLLAPPANADLAWQHLLPLTVDAAQNEAHD